MHPAKQSTIDHIGSWIIILITGLLPVFFLPVTQDYFDTNKWFLLIMGVLSLSGLVAIRAVITSKLIFCSSTTVKALGALAAVSIVSLIASTNKVEAAVAPFGAGTWVALFLTVAMGSTFLDEKSRGALRWTIYSVAGLVGLVAIYQFFGLSRVIGLTNLPGFAFLSDPFFTPAGTSVGLMIILAVTTPLLVGEIIIHRKKQGHDTHMIAAIIMTVAVVGGLILTAYQAIPQLVTGMLPYSASWQILLESYKQVKQLLVGVGAESYLTAFTVGRPLALNATAAWGTRYNIASSLFFHIATVYGLLGGTALFAFFITIIKEKQILSVTVSRCIALATALLLPPSFPAFVFIVSLLLVQSEGSTVKLTLPKKYALSYSVGAVIFLLLLASLYGLVRVYGGELVFATSLKALGKRDGTAAYNAHIQAIALNPSVARFHVSYSQTNLALANALAGTASASATPEQIKKDRDTATQLVQQAIREAKLAVNLAPNNILVWENIAAVYQELTGVAQGADQWTIAAYQQAIQLDPTNPALRLRLGGAFVGQQKFDRAAEQYVAAIQLKPNYANAYYNLAFIYRETKKYLAAAQAIREALKYVTPGSESATQGEKDLAALRELLTDAEKKALDNQELAAPTIEPPANPTSAPQTKSAPEPLSPLQ